METQHWRCILPVIRSHRITNAAFGCQSVAEVNNDGANEYEGGGS